MLSTKQIRGLVLEEIILVLLGKAGYRILTKQDDPLIFRDGKAGLEVQGRGEWHQIDALVGYDRTPAFLFPIRLGVEAKAYFPNSSSTGKVGIEIIRNAVGVVKDINENYSSFFSKPSQELKLKRYNYVYAIFSLYGFTQNAQRYAIAHQIYLIQYYHNHLFNGIKDILSELQGQSALEKQQSAIRQALRGFFRSPDNYYYELRNIFGDDIEFIDKLLKEINHIEGSYFGLLNGEYPIHILSKNPITDIADQDEYKANILVNQNGDMKIDLMNNELCFDLPEVISQILKEVWRNDENLAEFERRNKYFINLSGIIGGMRRDIQIKFEYPFP
ncbi:hypothetical protein [Anabaena catenula]|uniref:Restriction endonuclease n=1 Tax=Anabaena catenula FACHB-362 TaxID=2692877 RepID=A0ABR8J053_9NOST|nr:hypothetical protein [Anabaena catenula]MBD2691230.1 hypothetical protein [Anabaena catenula FACHB-362]